MITNEGLNSMATAYGSIPTHLVVGSSDVEIVATDNFMTGEFERIELDSYDVVDNTVKFYGKRLGVIASDDVITNFGLVRSGTLGTSDLESANLISSLIHSTDFDIEVEFWYTFNRVR